MARPRTTSDIVGGAYSGTRDTYRAYKDVVGVQDYYRRIREYTNKWRHQKNQENRVVSSSTRDVGAPKLWIYTPLIIFAIVVDLVQLPATLVALGITVPAALTAFVAAVPGWIVVFAGSVSVSIFFWLVGRSLGRRIKNSRKAGVAIKKTIHTVGQRAMWYRKGVVLLARHASRAAKNRMVLRSAVARGALIYTSKALRWLGKSLRFITKFSLFLETIPFINIVPWYTINMVLTYKEHRDEYRLAIGATREYAPVSVDEAGAFASYQQALIADADTYAETV